MICQTHRKTVGEVIDKLLSFAAIDNAYLGRFCRAGRVAQFLQATQKEWLDSMVARHMEAFPFTLEASRKTSWWTCYVPLKKALIELQSIQKQIIVRIFFCNSRFLKMLHFPLVSSPQARKTTVLRAFSALGVWFDIRKAGAAAF